MPANIVGNALDNPTDRSEEDIVVPAVIISPTFESWARFNKPEISLSSKDYICVWQSTSKSFLKIGYLFGYILLAGAQGIHYH